MQKVVDTIESAVEDRLRSDKPADGLNKNEVLSE